MGLQVFGTLKCQDTKKVERFLKERDLPFQFIDLAGKKGISPGELTSIAGAVGVDNLIDLEGARAQKKGLSFLSFEPLEEILGDPLLMRTPVIRDGRRALIGFDADALASFLAAANDPKHPKKPSR